MTFRRICLLAASAIFWACCAMPAFACSQPGVIGTIWAWAPSQTVAVGIYGFPHASAVQNSLNAWNGGVNTWLCTPATLDSSISSSGYSLSITFGHINNAPSGNTVRGITENDGFDINRRLQVAHTIINNTMTDDTAISTVVSHEIGHTFGLDDCPLCGINSSVMETGDTTTLNGQINPVTPTTCDFAAINAAGYYPCNPPVSGGGGTQNCAYGYDPNDYDNCYISPVIISLDRRHPELTDAQKGVFMSEFVGSEKLKIAWTPPIVSSEGWLVLDRDKNGLIDSLSEMFGNFTPQPAGDPQTYNGFRALAVFDRRNAGGNEDGRINEKDTVFSQLRIWVDRNHDGISQTDELLTLKQAGIVSISLDYRESRHSDQYGNRYRYRAAIEGDRDIFPWTYDVFLTSVQNRKSR